MRSISTFVVGLLTFQYVQAYSFSEYHVNYDDDPSYDHQKTTYKAQFEPDTIQTEIGVAPFFSPDWSIQTLTDLVTETPNNGILDIGEPGWDSWTGCTYSQDDDAYDAQCVGCTIEAMQEETFPLFQAILNAVHRGVRIRLLTNDYRTPTCKGQIAPLDWLALNGITIRFFTTTTFWHAKYFNQNNNVTAISSVNFSKASFMKNREAGVLITGRGASSIRAFTNQVFEHDWNQGIPYVVNQTYTAAEMKIITDPTMLPVKIPSQPNFPGSFVTPKPYFTVSNMQVDIFTSPDDARPTLFEDLDGAEKSFALHIYQITDMGLCQKLIDTSKRGINVTILISSEIYSKSDYELAKKCYETLYAAYVQPRKTPSYYEFSHQKYWIVDGVRVGLSTGNWSPTDFPNDIAGNGQYPPYGQTGWQAVNRDFNIKITEANIVDQFQTVFNEDFQRGSWWWGDATTVNSMKFKSLRG